MSTDSGQPELRIEKCKSCHSEISLPNDVRPTARIQCPLCHCEFSLAELTTPPMAIILDDGQTEPDRDQQKFDSIDAPIVDHRGGDGKNSAAEPEQQFVVPSYEKTTARGRAKAMGLEVPSTESHTRRKKRPTSFNRPHRSKRRSSRHSIKPNRRSEARRFVFGAVVLGPLLAIPVGQLIVWHAMQRDPFGLAPVVSKFAPLFVPEKLRPEDPSRDEVESLNEDGATATVPPDIPEAGGVYEDPDMFGWGPDLNENFPTIRSGEEKAQDDSEGSAR